MATPMCSWYGPGPPRVTRGRSIFWSHREPGRPGGKTSSRRQAGGVHSGAMTPERALALNAPLVTARLALEPQTAAHAPALFDAMQEEAIYAWISAVPPESVEALSAR